MHLLNEKFHTTQGGRGSKTKTKNVLRIIRMTTYCQPSLYLKLTQNDVENLKLRQRIAIWPGRSGRRKLFDCAFQTNFVKKFDLFQNIKKMIVKLVSFKFFKSQQILRLFGSDMMSTHPN